MSPTPSRRRILVVGATGHVGSQVTRILAQKGHEVTAVVRSKGRMIHGVPPAVRTVLADLNDVASLQRAVQGQNVVVSSANAIIPRNYNDKVVAMNEAGYPALIRACEEAGVQQFIQSSVPAPPKHVESRVPELVGKRVIEDLLEQSNMNTVAVRNPAFMDVWLPMAGLRQAAGSDPHATVARPYGFMKQYLSLVGNLAVKRGVLLAPGGASHGAPFISTRDVAELMAGCVGHPAVKSIIEVGGPEWVTWSQVAELVSERVGHRVRPVAMPAWLAGLGRLGLMPFSAAASNILALTQFVATYQPRWEASPWVERLSLPAQHTLADYLDQNLDLGV